MQLPVLEKLQPLEPRNEEIKQYNGEKRLLGGNERTERRKGFDLCGEEGEGWAEKLRKIVSLSAY